MLVEQNANMALNVSRPWLHYGDRKYVMDNPSEKLLKDEDVQENFILGLNSEGSERKSFKDVKALQKKKKVAFIKASIKI